MSSKRSAPPTPGSSEKKRKVLSLAEKMDVLAVDIRASGPAEEQCGRRSHQEKARSIYDHLAEKEPSGSCPAPGLLPAMGGSIDSSSVLACTTLLAQCVNDFNGFPAVTQQMKDIVDLAHTVGVKAFSDMTEEDVAELIDSHGAEASVEEIIQMNEDDQAGDDADEDDDTETRPVFTIMN
ncbi:hypothetical protein GWK47_014545 [Chionoecetes opilio]|uniref:Uncharacterized protein n=1 Tax=Chionoecetes opilio TaxID=41210 RepID=A0A8J5CIR1_CHIOP|nr:hypothetical protein GWK47_014545 [Chionoecetes opilio]